MGRLGVHVSLGPRFSITAPPPANDNSLDFSDAENSQYLALLEDI